MAGSNSLPQTSKPSDSDLESYSDDGDLKDLLVKKQRSLDTLRDTGEQLRLDVKNLEDELARRKKRRLDQVPFQHFGARDILKYDLSFLDLMDSTVQPPSPPSHSLVESSKCTFLETLALPFTSLTRDQESSFLSAVYVLITAFPDHPQLLRIYIDCRSWFIDRNSCRKAIRHFRDRLRPLRDMKEDFDIALQKATELEPEMVKNSKECRHKEDEAKQAKKTTVQLKSQIEGLQSKLLMSKEGEGLLSICSQIEELQEKLKSKEAEVVGLSNEADALLLKGKKLHDRHEAFCSHLRFLSQSVDSWKPDGIRWSQGLDQACEKYRSLTEKWNSLSKFDLDSLFQSSSTAQSPSRDGLADLKDAFETIRTYRSWSSMDRLIDRGIEKTDEDNGARIYYPSSDDPDPVEICYADMNCLAPTLFLRAPIMDFYIRYLQQQTSLTDGLGIDCLFLNTRFYQKLKDVVSSKQSDRETLFVNLRKSLKGVNIFQKAYILIPIHEYNHWSLAIICIPDKEDVLGPLILHLDSFGLHSSRSVFDNLKRYLIEEWRYLDQESACSDIPIAYGIWKNLDTKIRAEITTVPKQTDYCECGLFVLYYIQRFIGEAPKRLKKDIPKFGEQWFQPEEASDLRVKIRDLLENEFHKSHNQNIISSSSRDLHCSSAHLTG